jgi:hypothetical protein
MRYQLELCMKDYGGAMLGVCGGGNRTMGLCAFDLASDLVSPRKEFYFETQFVS